MRAPREFLILEIGPDGASDFAALEGRMGTPFAAGQSSDPEDLWWFAASCSDGRHLRIFAFQSWQRVELSGLLGQLGTPSLRMTMGPVDLKQFSASGPGAVTTERKNPPMILPGLIDALYRATGRLRLR